MFLNISVFFFTILLFFGFLLIIICFSLLLSVSTPYVCICSVVPFNKLTFTFIQLHWILRWKRGAEKYKQLNLASQKLHKWSMGGSGNDSITAANFRSMGQNFKSCYALHPTTSLNSCCIVHFWVYAIFLRVAALLSFFFLSWTVFYFTVQVCFVFCPSWVTAECCRKQCHMTICSYRYLYSEVGLD